MYKQQAEINKYLANPLEKEADKDYYNKADKILGKSSDPKKNKITRFNAKLQNLKIFNKKPSKELNSIGWKSRANLFLKSKISEKFTENNLNEITNEKHLSSSPTLVEEGIIVYNKSNLFDQNIETIINQNNNIKQTFEKTNYLKLLLTKGGNLTNKLKVKNINMFLNSNLKIKKINQKIKILNLFVEAIEIVRNNNQFDSSDVSFVNSAMCLICEYCLDKSKKNNPSKAASTIASSIMQTNNMTLIETYYGLIIKSLDLIADIETVSYYYIFAVQFNSTARSNNTKLLGKSVLSVLNCVNDCLVPLIIADVGMFVFDYYYSQLYNINY